MPFTTAQQNKIDAAQKLLDGAKAAYAGQVKSYDEYASAIAPCYKDPVPNAAAASTWFNSFSKGPCTGAGSCDLSKCKDRVDVLNTIIPKLKSNYNQQIAAQANFDKVMNEVINESKNDPANVLAQHQADADAAAKAESAKYKWIFGIVTVIIIGGAIFVYFKWFKK